MAASEVYFDNNEWLKQEFLTSGTFNVPTGVRQVFVEAVGGGGSGARTLTPTASLTAIASGGEAGSYVFSTARVTPGGVASITIGAGGVGISVVLSNTPGNPGGNTIFSGVDTITARGGLGGFIFSYNPNLTGLVDITGLVRAKAELSGSPGLDSGAFGGGHGSIGNGGNAGTNDNGGIGAGSGAGGSGNGGNGRITVWYKLP